MLAISSNVAASMEADFLAWSALIREFTAMKASLKHRAKTTVKKEATSAQSTTVAAPEAKPKVFKIKGGMKYRGAREAWYARLQQYEGRTEEEFVKAATADPPSKTKKDEAEPPSGWIAFFKRTGVAELV